MPRPTSAAATSASTGPVPCTSTEPFRLATWSTPATAASQPRSPASAENRTVTRRVCSAMSAPGAPRATIVPHSNTATRSHSRSASSMKCVTRTTLVPASRTARTRSHAVCRAAGSRPVVISSRKTSSGSFTKASAMNKRWRWPPDRSEKCVLRLPCSPHCVMSRSGSRAPGTNDANHRSASHTLIRCGSADSWSLLPIRLRSSPAWVSGSRPSTCIRPPSARRSPCRHSTVVVFPAPLRPRMPKISPRPTSKLTPSTTAAAP